MEPTDDEISNNNKKDATSTGEPEACFPCCRFTTPLSGCCGKRHRPLLKMRIAFKKLVENKWFDNGILFLIVASSSVLVSNDIYKITTLLQYYDVIYLSSCMLVRDDAN